MPPRIRRGPARLSRPVAVSARGATSQPPIRPVEAVRQGFGNLQAPTGYQHVLMGLMLAAFVIIGIRALADYAPADDMRSPGTETPAKGAAPIVLIVATLGVFFVLSFLATRGGWAARAAAAFGLLMIVALMINSSAELGQVATWIESIGTNSASQSAPANASPDISGGSNGSSTPSNPGNLPVTGPPKAF